MKKILFGMILVLSLFVLAACGDAVEKNDDVKINFITNGGTDIEDIVYTDDFTLPENPVLEGNTFDGWYTDSNFNNVFSLKDPIVDSINLYAKFTPLVYNVTYNMLGGDPVSSFELEAGEMIFPEINPNYEGFEFINYYYDEELTQVFGFEDMPANDVVLYAKWKAVSNGFIKIVFVPSRPANEIFEITAPLGEMMMLELEKLGIEVEGIEISVASTYEAAAIGLGEGTYDVAFLPATTYALYSENFPAIEPLLSAARIGLTKDSSSAMDWNDGLPTLDDYETYTSYYRGLIIAGTSTAARTLSTKVNSGVELVWDDVKDLNWCVRPETSSSGYIYQNYWIQQNFGKTFYDINNVVVTSGYSETIANLASGICDVGNVYSDARMHNDVSWTSEFGRTQSIWSETDVVGVTIPIMNDLIAVNNDNLSGDMIEALQVVFLELISTPDGQDVFSIYSHSQYVIATEAMYDELREVLNLN